MEGEEHSWVVPSLIIKPEEARSMLNRKQIKVESAEIRVDKFDGTVKMIIEDQGLEVTFTPGFWEALLTTDYKHGMNMKFTI